MPRGGGIPRDLRPQEYLLLTDDGPLGVASGWACEGFGGDFVKGFAGEAARGGDGYLAGHRCGPAVLDDLRRGWEMAPQGMSRGVKNRVFILRKVRK